MGFVYQDIDDCLSNPCHNGGTCEDQMGKYVCHCNGNTTSKECFIPGMSLCHFSHINLNHLWIKTITTVKIQLFDVKHSTRQNCNIFLVQNLLLAFISMLWLVKLSNSKWMYLVMHLLISLKILINHSSVTVLRL